MEVRRKRKSDVMLTLHLSSVQYRMALVNSVNIIYTAGAGKLLGARAGCCIYEQLGGLSAKLARVSFVND